MATISTNSSSTMSDEVKVRPDGSYTKDGDITWMEGRTKYGTRSPDGKGADTPYRNGVPTGTTITVSDAEAGGTGVHIRPIGEQTNASAADGLAGLAQGLMSSVANLTVPVQNTTGLTVEGDVSAGFLSDADAKSIAAKLKSVQDDIDKMYAARRAQKGTDGADAVKQHKLGLAAKNGQGSASLAPTPAPIVNKPIPAPAPKPVPAV